MTTTLRTRPAASEYAPFYHGYVEAVPDGDIVELLARVDGSWWRRSAGSRRIVAASATARRSGPSARCSAI
jgi:hypothetical protein